MIESDIWQEITDAIDQPSKNGRIQDGCIYVTEQEYDAIVAVKGQPKYPTETGDHISTLDLIVVKVGRPEWLRDGRAFVAVDGKLFLGGRRW